ncbi:MFS transporter [Salinicola aestuarinus]|uniref:MFS transporter n=1 Tax=Salinicola aestuarinus TaxID=1949082 RepID=UPI001CB6EB37|nr:MFS transporter [Salinicola aestuarinus]
MSSTSSPTAERADASAGRDLSILLLAISAFVIVTTEFVIVGLLPSLARDLDVSISTAGQLVTLFAFTVMLFGPLLTSLVSHIDRKRLFVAILVLFAAANTLAAVSTNVWVLAIARILPALALPVFWGTASETAASIAGPDRAGKAVSNVYLGIAGAMVLGIPMGTLATGVIGWRGTFVALAALSLVMAILLQIVMPTLERPSRLRLKEQASILKSPFFLANLALSVVVFTAMFTAYTYLADLLERLADIPSEQVGWWLMGFGVTGLFGNWLGGQFVERAPLRATLVGVVALAIAMAATVSVTDHPLLLAIAIVFWGIANTALYPICQVRVMQAATHAQALAGTLNVSMANAGIGLGAIIGGAVIDRFGMVSLGIVAAAIALLAAAAIPFVRHLSR